jgi:hypothetical protein
LFPLSPRAGRGWGEGKINISEGKINISEGKINISEGKINISEGLLSPLHTLFKEMIKRNFIIF